VGTAPYMSPEQAQGLEVDGRSDIFSLGSLLYEMVTGKRAFTGDTTVALLASVVQGDPVKVSVLVPSVPLDLEKVITRAIRKERERRFQSMADVRVELQEIKEELDSGSGITAEDVLRAAPRRRSRPGIWLAAGFAALVMGAAGWFYYFFPPERTELAYSPPSLSLQVIGRKSRKGPCLRCVRETRSYYTREAQDAGG